MRRTCRGLVILVVCVSATTGLVKGDTIRLIHGNDTFGNLSDEDGRSSLRLAQRVTAIKALSRGHAAVVLSAGNELGPGTLSVWDRGATMAGILRQVGTAALVPGAKEFDFGLEVLATRVEEGKFSLLAANLEGADAQAFLAMEVSGVQVGVIGVVSPLLMDRLGTDVASSLTVSAPAAAVASTVKILQGYGVDVIVVVAQASEQEAMDLARAHADVDVVVFGGRSERADSRHEPTLIQLANGVRLVTTPAGGAHLGVVDVTVEPLGDRFEITDVDASLVEVASYPADPEAQASIEALAMRYANESGDLLGQIEGVSRDEQARAIANLMRLHTETEVGIVSRGSFTRVIAPSGFYRRDLDRLIRYDDGLTKMELTGAQLRRAVGVSQGRKGSDTGLIFAGLDPEGRTINGRPIQSKERYRIVTVRRLAEGRDGYGVLSEGASLLNTNISLRSLAAAGLQAWGTLSSTTFRDLNVQPVWRSILSVEGSFNRNYVDSTTVQYRDAGEKVSFLRGETSFAWKETTRYQLAYETSGSVTALDVLGDFGRVAGETTSDQLDTELNHRWRWSSFGADPFVSTGFRTAFTKGAGGRPYQARGTAGFQRQFLKRWVAEFAARGQRDFNEDQSDYGAEITLNYRLRLKTGGRLHTKVESFFGFSDRKVIAIENYNTLGFPLAGQLSLTVRQNNFIYRVDKIRGIAVEGVAIRSELTIGLAYGLDWKWI